MTRLAFIKKYALKFGIVLILLGLIAYTVGHAMSSSARGLLTTPLSRVTDKETASLQGYLFREETVLKSETAGLVYDTVSEGTKVAKNQTVARVYPSKLSPSLLKTAQLRLDALSRAIRILEESTPVAGDNTARAEDYRVAATEAYAQICRLSEAGSALGLVEIEEDLLVAFNRYLLLSGKQESLASVITDLTAKRDALLVGESTDVLNLNASGTYYGRSHVDGYETLFTAQALAELTQESLDALKNAAPSVPQEGETVGKIVYGYSWYLALTLPDALAKTLTEGRQYEVCFPQNGGRSLRMTVERLDGSLAVLRSDDCPPDFVYYRAQTVELTVTSRQGFYIPDSALYQRDGVEGVYVFENSTAYFRPVEILYRGDGYSIVAAYEDDPTSKLRENDILVTAGKNLYDGKVYR